jgi:predicted short-subunit dehydrogenase-like oxidoreductase (DUF2520 family)
VTFRVAVIGAGRMGQGIALALSRSGAPVSLLGRTDKQVPAPLAVRVDDWGGACREAEVVLIATPDAAIPAVAERLLAERCLSGRQSVLHLSGLLGRDALGPLAATGAGLGSFHPLQTVADPETAQERLRGAYAGIEGDDRALAAGERLARTLGMTPVRIPTGAKAAYHAGATLVANYTVALMGMAVRLAEAAGVPAELAGRIYLPLLHGAAVNLDRLAPAEALTGAIRRGDAGTVAAHLGALCPADRVLYAVVGLEALALSRDAGLGDAPAAELEQMLKQAATGR